MLSIVKIAIIVKQTITPLRDFVFASTIAIIIKPLKKRLRYDLGTA